MPLLRDRVAIALKRVCSDKDRKETKTKKMRFCDEDCTWTAHDKLLLIHGLRLLVFVDISTLFYNFGKIISSHYFHQFVFFFIYRFQVLSFLIHSNFLQDLE